MMSNDKRLFKTLITCSLFIFFITTTFAQKEIVPQLKDGIDLFPVYKASSKTCYIDSVVYTGPFVVFCVSFEKPIADKNYHLKAPNSAKSWRAYTGKGYRRPLMIKNVGVNNRLLATSVKATDVVIPLEAIEGTSEVAHVHCQFQFLRSDFQTSKVELVEDIEQINVPKSTSVSFTSIRLRKKNYNRLISTTLKTFYEGNYEWSDHKLLKKMSMTVNDAVVKPAWTKVTSTGGTPSIPLSYSVRKYDEGKLYLEDIQETTTNTVFTVCVYSGRYSAMHLYHHKKEGFWVTRGTEKIPMQTIKNVRINEYLIHEEVKSGKTLSINKLEVPFLLTFEVHFERLPKEWRQFDLIETYKGGEGRPFSFFEVKMK